MFKPYKIVLLHALFWVPFMLLGNLVEYASDREHYTFYILDAILTQLPNAVTVYLCIYVCNKFANPIRIFPLTIGIFMVFIVSYANWYLISYVVRQYTNANGSPPESFDFFQFTAAIIWIFTRFSILGFGYYYATQSIKHQKKLRLIEKEKHDAEYAFLRAQINPHFLNNTLNFFFAKLLPISKELSSGIMTLSEIMRYSLAIDSDDRMTLIEEEIEHIKNVIKINQLRFNHKLQIDFEIKGNTHNVRVIPLILITVVENILKHGNCTDKNYPVKIFLNVNEADGYVYLNTFNRKKKGPKELSSGIGLDNIKKRLAHHYQKKFILNITESEQDYLLDLSIPFSTSANEVKHATQISLAEQFTLQTIKPKPYTP